MVYNVTDKMGAKDSLLSRKGSPPLIRLAQVHAACRTCLARQALSRSGMRALERMDCRFQLL